MPTVMAQSKRPSGPFSIAHKVCVDNLSKSDIMSKMVRNVLQWMVTLSAEQEGDT